MGWTNALSEVTTNALSGNESAVGARGNEKKVESGAKNLRLDAKDLVGLDFRVGGVTVREDIRNSPKKLSYFKKFE